MPKGTKFVDYARPIYESWDREGTVPPPKGYNTWIDYLDVVCELNTIREFQEPRTLTEAEAKALSEIE
ncbi:MAG: hypothetical protein JRD89_01965 [Deltaproteobacteria bacterium]|nr:hypothetical protein [Deltaproteobacteria bacterium]